MNDRISGQSIRSSDVKKSYKGINLIPLINKTKTLSSEEKGKLNDLICYLTIALHSRYSRFDNDKNIKYFNKEDNYGKFKIIKENVQEVLRSIFNDIVAEDINTILSMCTHKHTTWDSVTSFTETAEIFFKATSLELDYKKLQSIKESLDNNLKIKLGNNLLKILMICANNDLSNMNLAGANLYMANLVGANLKEANLDRANLVGANLKEARLEKAILERANLERANLEEANLKEANLYMANLVGANLVEANLVGAHLGGANLEEANLVGANLVGAHLGGANLGGANLGGANLGGANLAGANLRRANLRGVNLSSTKLDNIDTFEILTPHDIDLLDLYFNHINNDSGSILTAINSIDNKYKDLKINLMHQALDFLETKNINISTIIYSLEDILYSNQFYVEDKNINHFIVNKLLASKIKSAKTKAIAFKDVEITLIDRYINTLAAEPKTKFMLNNNAFINQLVYYSESSGDEDIKNIGKNLKHSYFELPQIQKLINYCKNSKDCFLEPENNQFIFLYEEGYTNFQAIMISREYMTKNLYNKIVENHSQVDWTCLTHFKVLDDIPKVQEVGKLNLEVLFNTFIIFKANYQCDQNNAKFIKLLELLNLGEYHNLFIEATKSKTKKIDLTTDEKQQKLKDIFNKFLINLNNLINVNLKDDHFNNIVAEFQLADKTVQEKAQVLLCLSGIFAKYSSSSFFGTELESPINIRYYALGLMNKALELDSNVVPSNYQKDNKEDWRNKLLGKNGAFACTAALSDIILLYCNEKFPDIVNAIKPPAW